MRKQALCLLGHLAEVVVMRRFTKLDGPAHGRQTSVTLLNSKQIELSSHRWTRIYYGFYPSSSARSVAPSTWPAR